MIFKDYYKILGLDTNRVSLDEIKIAYRKQAKKYHPDVDVGNKKNEEIFKDINEAYKVLSTASGKRKYDRMWNHNVGRKKRNTVYEENKNTGDSIFSDFINLCFGKTENNKKSKSTQTKQKMKGENVQTEVNVSIEDAFRGKEQRIAVRTIDGDLKTFKIQLPPGIQNNEKIRLVGQRKTWRKWWEKWRFINTY